MDAIEYERYPSFAPTISGKNFIQFGQMLTSFDHAAEKWCVYSSFCRNRPRCMSTSAANDTCCWRHGECMYDACQFIAQSLEAESSFRTQCMLCWAQACRQNGKPKGTAGRDLTAAQLERMVPEELRVSVHARGARTSLRQSHRRQQHALPILAEEDMEEVGGGEASAHGAPAAQIANSVDMPAGGAPLDIDGSAANAAPSEQAGNSDADAGRAVRSSAFGTAGGAHGNRRAAASRSATQRQEQTEMSGGAQEGPRKRAHR